jgi:TonB family protein
VVAAPPAVPPRIDYASRSEANCDSEAARDQFPQAAMEAGITEMVVRLRIEVDANGRVTRVQPLNNPGFGFAAAAERVVRSHCQFRPARDHEGHAVPYVFGSFPVTFELE